MLDVLDDHPGPFRNFLANFATSAPASGWAPHIAWRRVALIDGRQANGTMMRRRVAGRWQYRSMTEDEQIEAVIDRTW